LRCVFDDDPPTGFGYKYWIEGLGGTNGVYNEFILKTNVLLMEVSRHSASFRNDTTLYDNPDYDSCWFVLYGDRKFQSK
jgi:hypothetical protein